MMEKALDSSHLLVKEMNKKKERISKSKATGSAAASMNFCLCAPPTHPGSFKCRLHRATSSSYPRTVPVSVLKHCVCAPATHPGSFKCRLHRATASSHTRSGKSFCYVKQRVVTRIVQLFMSSQKMSLFFFFSVSSFTHHITGVKCTKNLNPLKLAAPSQSGGIRNSNKGNVHGKPKLSRFGRAALAHAASAAATSVQIQPISAAFRQMNLDQDSQAIRRGKEKRTKDQDSAF
ncbi:uncharacterized protein LOC107873567 isoform X1 [Capsicum annuum]|uniref:uncharacterized protein LOC107873567 isoform X1 n=1 Tax=Capsicum annuum TaxID=4072 RepID=UPI001FB0956E|nr:uncharacterized protein LOC107873567 isoform X1 [Capsicum annuum]XP_047269446.1 uncharacterized protein LOC107873567 isoform X1 [Capsicum annuum]XP_047269447.1 uncharacterized protein LOC107873567 isoform X1 [Capsicum annuum]